MTHRHGKTEKERGDRIQRGQAIANRSRIQAQPGTEETSTPFLACTVSCTAYRAVFQKLQFIKCEKSVSLNHSAALAGQAVSYGKGAGELGFEKRWRKWAGFYRITPHLADLKLLPDVTLLWFRNLWQTEGGCAECQMTYNTWNLPVWISTKYWALCLPWE